MLAGGPVRGELERLQRELGRLCVALDPDDIPLPEVGAVWSAFDSLERLASGAKCRLARRVEQSRAWQGAGARSPAEHLARLAGTTTGRARATLETSKALGGLAGTDAALARGELSDQQAEAVAGAAKADPSSEARLLELARRRELRELREAAARVRAQAEDEAQRAKRLADQRSLRTWTAADGSWNLMVRNTPEVGAELEAALAPVKEAIFQAARLAGDHESGEAYGADALAEVVRRAVAGEPRGCPESAPAGAAQAAEAGPGRTEDRPEAATATDDDTAPGSRGNSASGPPPVRSRRPDTKVIVLIDYESLKRGWAEADERCEIAGVGPISVATARSLMTDAFGAAIVTDGVDVFSVAHAGRAVTAHQRSALEARGYRCEVPGCGSTTAVEIDHIEDWRHTFRTKLDQLCFLCKLHHRDKTYRGWRLEGPPGHRRWRPPDGVAAPASPGPGEETATPSAPPTSLFDDPTAA